MKPTPTEAVGLHERPIDGLRRRIALGVAGISLLGAGCTVEPYPNEGTPTPKTLPPEGPQREITPTTTLTSGEHFISLEKVEYSQEIVNRITYNSTLLNNALKPGYDTSLYQNANCSGFYINTNEGRYIVTAKHCVSTTIGTDGKRYSTIAANGENMYMTFMVNRANKSTLLGEPIYSQDPVSPDVALLKLDVSSKIPNAQGVELGESQSVLPGESVITIGHAGSILTPLTDTMTFTGWQNGYMEFIITAGNKTCLPGGSGSLVSDMNGKAVAIITAKLEIDDLKPEWLAKRNIDAKYMHASATICYAAPIENALELIHRK